MVGFAQQLAWNGLLEGITFPEPEIPEWDGSRPHRPPEVGDSLLDFAFTDFTRARSGRCASSPAAGSCS